MPHEQTTYGKQFHSVSESLNVCYDGDVVASGPCWLNPGLSFQRLAAESDWMRTDLFGNPINQRGKHFDTQRQALVTAGTSFKSSFLKKCVNTEIKIISKPFPRFLNEPCDF